MDITLEQVEKVCRYTGVSFTDAKAALEQSGGSPLDAVILLEGQGKAKTTAGGTYTTCHSGTSAREETGPSGTLPIKASRPRRCKYTGKEVGEALKSLFRNCTKISVDVWRGEDLLVGIPLIICALLFVVAPYVMIPLTIVGLLLRCRYHVSGWEGSTETINRTMDQVTDTVADWTDQIKREMRDCHNKYNKHEK